MWEPQGAKRGLKTKNSGANWKTRLSAFTGNNLEKLGTPASYSSKYEYQKKRKKREDGEKNTQRQKPVSWEAMGR